LDPGATFAIDEIAIPRGASDPPLRLVAYLPRGAAEGAIYYVHAGGMVHGNVRSRETRHVLDMARELSFAVVEVDYALAPEHPYPAGVEDCYSGLRWISENADRLGISADRLVMYGLSGGGGLAAGAALLARDRGGPSCLGLLLSAPMMDDRETPSRADSGLVELTAMWEAVLRGIDPEQVPPYAAPGRALDLSNLPPMFLNIGSRDQFRDEVLAFGQRVWSCGGRAELHLWDRGTHGMEIGEPTAPYVRESIRARIEWVRRLLDE
jgi:acetyl esterase/lipase